MLCGVKTCNGTHTFAKLSYGEYGVVYSCGGILRDKAEAAGVLCEFLNSVIGMTVPGIYRMKHGATARHLQDTVKQVYSLMHVQWKSPLIEHKATTTDQDRI